MKRTAWLLITVLGTAMCMCAQNTAPATTQDPGQAATQDAGQATMMTGMLCNSKCVVQTSGQASCNEKCAEKKGEIVLVDDQGQVLKIANQEKVMEHVGKKVKMSCRRVPGAKNTMYVDTVSLYGGGG